MGETQSFMPLNQNRSNILNTLRIAHIFKDK